MKKTVLLLPVLATLAVGAEAKEGSTKLVNLDTNYVQPQGTYSFGAGVRWFGNEEDKAYGLVSLDYGIGNNLALSLRGTFSKFENFAGNGFTIRHGGSDIELMLKGRLPEELALMWGLGVSLPNTPAQDKPFVTAEVVYGATTDKVDFFIGPRGVFREDSTLVGVGAGFSTTMSDNFMLFGDVTGILTGDNTYSVNNGAKRRDWIYGLGIRFFGSGGTSQYSFEAGITNGIGSTTGFSLTPALGKGIGVFLGLNIRY